MVTRNCTKITKIIVRDEYDRNQNIKATFYKGVIKVPIVDPITNKLRNVSVLMEWNTNGVPSVMCPGYQNLTGYMVYFYIPDKNKKKIGLNRK